MQYDLYKCSKCGERWTFSRYSWVSGYLRVLLTNNPCRVCGWPDTIKMVGTTNKREGV